MSALGRAALIKKRIALLFHQAITASSSATDISIVRQVCLAGSKTIRSSGRETARPREAKRLRASMITLSVRFAFK